MIEGSIFKSFKAQLGERVDVAFKAIEKVQIGQVKFFSRDQYVIEAPISPGLLDVAEEAENQRAALPAHQPSESEPVELPPAGPSPVTEESPSQPTGLGLEVPNFLNVIKAWDLKGSRVQVEFVVLNNSDEVIAIRDVILLVGPADTPDALRFKQFVEVRADARVPSDLFRLPVVGPANSGLWLCAEMEGAINVGFGPDARECRLIASFAQGNVELAFLAHGNPVLEMILEQLQTTATDAKAAISFALPTSRATYSLDPLLPIFSEDSLA